MVRVAQAIGAEVLTFDEGAWGAGHPSGVEYTTTVYGAKTAYEAQRLVSVPVIKTHRHASFNCALKNTVGCVHGKNKPWIYGSGREEAIAALHTAVHPHRYVVDGCKT